VRNRYRRARECRLDDEPGAILESESRVVCGCGFMCLWALLYHDFLVATACRIQSNCEHENKSMRGDEQRKGSEDVEVRSRGRQERIPRKLKTQFVAGMRVSVMNGQNGKSLPSHSHTTCTCRELATGAHQPRLGILSRCRFYSRMIIYLSSALNGQCSLGCI
jgi:hypothetical protein